MGEAFGERSVRCQLGGQVEQQITQRGERVVASGGSLDTLFEPHRVMPRDRRDEIGLGGITSVDGGLADARVAGDIDNGSPATFLGEHGQRRDGHPLVIAACVGPSAGPGV